MSLKDVADFGDKVTARLSGVTAIDASARIPGELAGPALSIDVTLDNASSRAIDLTAVVVNVYGEDGSPGLPLTENGSSPFHGLLASGKSARGVYVFTLAPGRRAPVTVTVTYSASAPVVLFVGNTQ